MARDTKLAYAALMYRSEGDAASELADLGEAARRADVSVEFFSVPTASLRLARAGRGEQDLPFVTDRVAILSAESSAQLKRFASSGLTAALDGSEVSWLGRMERSL
jgi:hypothetical protein